MMKSQQYGQPTAAVAHWRAPAAGELVACAGLWLTRRGDLKDHVLHPGERVRLDRGDDVVMEALRQDAAPLWRWQPAARPADGWRARLGHLLRPAVPAFRPGSCTHA
jgi:hypothetical protein